MTTHKTNHRVEVQNRRGIFFDELLNKIKRLDEDSEILPELRHGEVFEISATGSTKQGAALKKKERMIELIFKNINQNARKRNFEKAIQLREMLFKLDPKAIKEIFKSGQLIEAEMYKFELEKGRPVNQGAVLINEVVHEPAQRPQVIQISRSNIDWSDKKIEFMGHWFNFYRKLSDNELVAFTDHLKSIQYDDDTMIITQGTENNRLFFISDGSVRNIYLEKGARKFDGELRGGDIAGVETFFDGKVSSKSLLATTGTKVDYIEKEDLYKLQTVYPELERKLKEFCHNHNDDSAMIILKHDEKRVQKRVEIGGLTAAKLLNTSGIPTGKPFRGEMIDISEGGFSFQIKMAEDVRASRLLGKKIVSLIKVDSKKSSDDVFWGGVIVDVCKRNDKAFSIHLKGDDASQKLTKVLRVLCT